MIVHPVENYESNQDYHTIVDSNFNSETENSSLAEVILGQHSTDGRQIPIE